MTADQIYKIERGKNKKKGRGEQKKGVKKRWRMAKRGKCVFIEKMIKRRKKKGRKRNEKTREIEKKKAHRRIEL